MEYGKFMWRSKGKREKTSLSQRLERPWPYWLGGIALGILNIGLFWQSNEALKISTGIACMIGEVARAVGIDSQNWYFFEEGTSILKESGDFVNNSYTFLIVGIILGATIGALCSSQWRIRKMKKQQVIYAIGGGILMGIGARMASGCNLGAFFSAIPSFSLHGWVFGISLFGGAYVGIKILLKYRV